MPSSAREEFESQFGEEYQLNKEFRLFVDNYRKAYEGRREDKGKIIIVYVCVCVTDFLFFLHQSPLNQELFFHKVPVSAI